MAKYVIAHDLGTSGNKATLFNEEGMLVASRVASYQTVYAAGNRAEQDPSDWCTVLYIPRSFTSRYVGIIPPEKYMVNRISIIRRFRPASSFRERG